MPPQSQMMSDVFPELSAVRDAISKKQPFCTGTYPLADKSGRLFFLDSDGTGAHCVDLANANDPKLHTLVGACERASFGLDKKDILDETYRKAWKMDSSRFSTSFDIVNTGILDHVYAKLTPGSPDMIRPELYKLNAYGPGSFFKAHKDTPRSEEMFGSLVVVFPISHEGGALQLRHRGDEWTFDSAALTSAEEAPSIAYIAFYSDVEHEVNTVTSGFRVTLTYNLFWDCSTQEMSLLSTKEPLRSNSKWRSCTRTSTNSSSSLREGGRCRTSRFLKAQGDVRECEEPVGEVAERV